MNTTPSYAEQVAEFTRNCWTFSDAGLDAEVARLDRVKADEDRARELEDAHRRLTAAGLRHRNR